MGWWSIATGYPAGQGAAMRPIEAVVELGQMTIADWNERIAARIPGAEIEPGCVSLRRWSWVIEVDGGRMRIALDDAPEIAIPLDHARATCELLCAAVDAGATAVEVLGERVDPELLRGGRPAVWDGERVAQLFVVIRADGASLRTDGLDTLGVPELEGEVSEPVLRFAAGYSLERRRGLPEGQQMLIEGRLYAIERRGERQAIVRKR